MSVGAKEWIESGKASLGIELGSTRIKAVLIGPDHETLAFGGHEWENRLDNNIWTYRMEDVWAGLQDSYRELNKEVQGTYGVELEKIQAIGFSAMMHGYLAFDAQDELLVPFRTWRNTMTEKAAEKLTEAFSFNIPQRWSIAHLYQAILNKEEHVKQISFMTTLAGYVHWQLTGEKVLGIGDASGVFPIDSAKNDYDAGMIATFEGLIANESYPWTLSGILPKVLLAGQEAGKLTEAGAKLLDPTGRLQPGAILCPPEGDAGTGMVATHSVAQRTGNVSAGTSIFAMLVLEKPLSKVYTEIDMVTTPTGKPVAMVHCNNCSSDVDAWIRLFEEFAKQFGMQADKTALYQKLYTLALEQGEADCGGLLAYNYYSGEPITGLEAGCPLFVRLPDGNFNLANFMRTLLNSLMATLKIGMDILASENVKIDSLLGHGGLFRTAVVGQAVMAAALNIPVSVMDSASEGGAWGIALLASYAANRASTETLEAYLDEKVFANSVMQTIEPDPVAVKGFEEFMKRYQAGLAVEAKAVECLL